MSRQHVATPPVVSGALTATRHAADRYSLVEVWHRCRVLTLAVFDDEPEVRVVGVNGKSRTFTAGMGIAAKKIKSLLPPAGEA